MSCFRRSAFTFSQPILSDPLRGLVFGYFRRTSCIAANLLVHTHFQSFGSFQLSVNHCISGSCSWFWIEHWHRTWTGTPVGVLTQVVIEC